MQQKHLIKTKNALRVESTIDRTWTQLRRRFALSAIRAEALSMAKEATAASLLDLPRGLDAYEKEVLEVLAARHLITYLAQALSTQIDRAQTQLYSSGQEEALDELFGWILANAEPPDPRDDENKLRWLNPCEWSLPESHAEPFLAPLALLGFAAQALSTQDGTFRETEDAGRSGSEPAVCREASG